MDEWIQMGDHMIVNQIIRMFPSDLWVVNLREGARIVACRAPWERNTVGENFSERFSEESFAKISEYLFSYEMEPMVTETLEGKIVIVIPSLMPSSTLAVVLLPQIDRKILLRFLAKRSGIDFAWDDSLTSEAEGRMPGNVVNYEEELRRLLWEIEMLSFSALSPLRRGESCRIDGFLKKRIQGISELAGCEVTLGEWRKICNSESFDFGVFTAFLLLSLLFCRTVAHSRCAEIGIADGTDEEDAFLTVRAQCEEISEALSWELGTLESMTEERLMLFETNYSEGQFRLKIIPRRIDVSYLGLKAALTLKESNQKNGF